jgi:hypothetical protein
VKVTSLVQTWYKAAFALAAIGFSLNQRGVLLEQSATVGARPTIVEGVVAITSNPYLFAYITVVAWLVYVAVALPYVGETIVMARYGSRSRWLVAQATKAASEAGQLIVIASLCALAGSVGFAFSGDWGQLSTMSGSGNQILTTYARTSLSPLLAWLLQAVLSVLVLTALFTIAAAINAYATRSRPLVLTLTLVTEFIGVLLLSRASSAGAASGLVLLYDARLPGWPATPLILAAVASVAAVVIVAAIERRPRTHRHLNAALLTYIAIVVAGMLVSTRPAISSSLADELTGTFYGASIDGFQLATYALYNLAFLGLPYIAVLQTESGDVNRMPLLAIRHGRLWPWLRGILIRQLLASAALVVGTVLLAAAITLVAGGTLITPQLGQVLHQFALNGVLQAYVSTLIVLGVLLATGSDQATLAALAALILLGLPALTHGWFPAGLNMLGYLYVPGFSPARATIILATSAVVLTAACWIATTRTSSQQYLSGRIHARH